MRLFSAAIFCTALCYWVPAARAAWTTLGTFTAEGASWVPYSGTTANGVQVAFELASDLPACGPSLVFYHSTTARVEYDETVVGGATTALAVRFTYASGDSYSHWRAVAAQGLSLHTPVAPLLANGAPDPGGDCAMWGSDGVYGRFGIGDFDLTRGTGCPRDRDCDGVPDRKDNCPEVWNSDQQDSDSDGLGDVCDNCPYVTNNSRGKCQGGPKFCSNDATRQCKANKNCASGGLCQPGPGQFCSNQPTQRCQTSKDCGPQADTNPPDGIGDACESGWRLGCSTGTREQSWLKDLIADALTTTCDSVLGEAVHDVPICSGVLFLTNLLHQNLIPEQGPENYARIQVTYGVRPVDGNPYGQPTQLGLLKAQLVKAVDDPAQTASSIDVVVWDLDNPSSVLFRHRFENIPQSQWLSADSISPSAPELTFPIPRGVGVQAGVHAAITLIATFDENGKNPWCAMTSHLGVVPGYDDDLFQQKMQGADQYITPYLCRARGRFVKFSDKCGDAGGTCSGTACSPNGQLRCPGPGCCSGLGECYRDDSGCPFGGSCCHNDKSIGCQTDAQCDLGECRGGGLGDLGNCIIAWDNNARDGFARKQYDCDGGIYEGVDPFGSELTSGLPVVNDSLAACQCGEYEGPTDGDTGAHTFLNINAASMNGWVYPQSAQPPLWYDSEWNWIPLAGKACKATGAPCFTSKQCGKGDSCVEAPVPQQGW
jgi:hypothetical protein